MTVNHFMSDATYAGASNTPAFFDDISDFLVTYYAYPQYQTTSRSFLSGIAAPIYSD
jgi:hypothetical protein